MMERNLKFELSSYLPILAITASALIATGCGQNGNSGMASMVQNMQIRTYDVNGETYAELTTQLSTGNMILSGVDLPIVDPHHPERIYGHLALRSSFCQAGKICAGNELSIALNVSQITRSDSAALRVNTLPNGTPIPIGGLQGSTVLGLPIGKTGALAYLGYGDNVALVGAALPFKQLDKVGGYVPGVNIFQPFGSDKVNGIVGIFTGAGPGQTGIGLFVDFYSAMHQDPAPVAGKTVVSLAKNLVSSMAIAPQATRSRLTFRDVRPSALKEYRVYQRINEINQQGGVLNLR